MSLSLDGIKYFQTYYQNLLLLAVSASMVGWIFYLYQQLGIETQNVKNEPKRSSSVVIGFVLAFTLVSAFIYGDWRDSSGKEDF